MNLRSLLQPDAAWLDDPHPRRICGVALATVLGLAAYGFTVGWWRSPLMGVYVALKMPLLVACTLGCNGLLNALLGLLLGTGLGFRQSLLALLMSFAVAALILGSLAPITFFLAWNAPPPDSASAGMAHSAYLVTHTFLIGFAGIAANVHLHQLLAARAPNRSSATLTLLAWLAGNGFLGAQFSWVLRPFFGSPNLEVAFLRPDPLRGNFYESVWYSIGLLSSGHALTAIFSLLLLASVLAIPVIAAITSYKKPTP
jgi:hypothetical protein